MSQRQKRWRKAISENWRRMVMLPLVATAIIVAACTTPPLSFGSGQLPYTTTNIFGDSMIQGPAVTTFNQWLYNSGDFTAVSGFADNGSGFFCRGTGRDSTFWDQMPESGEWAESVLASGVWNDLVRCDLPVQQVIEAFDSFLEIALAEGVKCVRWILNRDDHKFNLHQAVNWSVHVNTLQDLFDGVDKLAVFNDHLRGIASASPVEHSNGNKLDFGVIEWGEAAEASLHEVTMPAHGSNPAVPGTWWSTWFDRGAVQGSADQVFGWPENDFDIVHPGVHGGPFSGSKRIVDMSRAALMTCDNPVV